MNTNRAIAALMADDYDDDVTNFKGYGGSLEIYDPETGDLQTDIGLLPEELTVVLTALRDYYRAKATQRTLKATPDNG